MSNTSITKIGDKLLNNHMSKTDIKEFRYYLIEQTLKDKKYEEILSAYNNFFGTRGYDLG